jgi:hypothetical protein
MADLTSIQLAILRALNFDSGYGGFVIGNIASFVARQPGHESNRAHSALISLECRTLERAGLLRRLDDETPIAWCIASGETTDGGMSNG